MKKHPDIGEVIKAKDRHRRALAALPFEEKIEMVFKLRERREFIKAGRATTKPRKPKTERA